MNGRVSFREGIGLQPRALAASRPIVEAALAAADLTPMRQGTIALVGIGASLYAATAGAAQWRAQGRRAFALTGTDLYEAEVDAADSYVALSASGRSVEPAKAMELRPDRFRLGIAKAVEVPLRQVVSVLIGTGTGPDSGPNTTSYVGSLQAVGLLAEHVGRPTGFDWTGLPDQVERVLADTRAAVARATALLAGRFSLDCVGAGTAYGTAGYAALLIREAVRVAAQNWDTLNFLHGPMEPNDPRSGVILFGDGREVKLAQDLAGFGIASVLITSRTDAEDKANLVVIPMPKLGNGLAEAILYAIPAQLLTAELAEAAGLPTCVFRYRQTNTKLAEPASAASPG
jgi:fructoselysine-6-P-deglycase FrlB-like protein